MTAARTDTISNLRDRCRAELHVSRRRMLDVAGVLTDTELCEPFSELMSPVVWDLAHVGNYEELWLLYNVAGVPTTSAHLDDLYNAFEHPRWQRPSLPILEPDAAREYIAEVRRRAFEVLDHVDLAGDDRLTHGGFVYGMVAQHEHQHIETVIATLQLSGKRIERRGLSRAGLESSVPNHRDRREVLIAAGPFTMGSRDPWAYDNERPAHEVHVDDFWIDTKPVTNAAFVEFIDDGGYIRPELWSEAGRRWRQEADLTAPGFWTLDGGEFRVQRFGESLPVTPDEPVQHVCWYEADAFCRWAGRRLPTEAEWEKAAAAGGDGLDVRYPWGDTAPTPGRANLALDGRMQFGPAPAGSLPEGAAPSGCLQMLGDVWEWTASDFLPYPGFEAFPYREYSEVFFGDEYKVLRGGSWATHPPAIRTTFRNWDYPIRRQIFTGFRTARSA